METQLLSHINNSNVVRTCCIKPRPKLGPGLQHRYTQLLHLLLLLRSGSVVKVGGSQPGTCGAFIAGPHRKMHTSDTHTHTPTENLERPIGLTYLHLKHATLHRNVQLASFSLAGRRWSKPPTAPHGGPNALQQMHP